MKSDIDKFIVHLYAMFSPNQINESKTKIHVTKFMNNHGLVNNMKVLEAVLNPQFLFKYV